MVSFSKRLLISVSLLLALSGCYSNIFEPPKTKAKDVSVQPPCGPDRLAKAELGRPWTEYAEFATQGGQIYATASGFSHGGVFDSAVGDSRLYVGSGTPENYSFQGGEGPSNAILSIGVKEDTYAELELPAGTYWLISSNRAEIALVSCIESGVSTVRTGVPQPDN
jgi:hypothetical protein